MQLHDSRVTEENDLPETFTIHRIDGFARTGTLRLPRGTVRTPVFMPVGTQAAVKALDPSDLKRVGAEIILANTYHLMLRPGADLIQQLGGASHFMRWDKPLLTDSGGYQVYSLARNRKLSADGVTFRSHINGSEFMLSPETSIELQYKLQADITMALDVCVGFDTDDDEQEQAAELTHAWLPRNIRTFRSLQPRDGSVPSLLFGIAQGGFSATRRQYSAKVVAESDVDGCAIGGLSVGEPKSVMAEMLTASVQELPWDRPRYLMGVGSPEDLWNAVEHGIDMFDCVLPTRVARHGGLFTLNGRINIKNQRFRSLNGPIDSSCDCYMCSRFPTAYVHHLFRCGELLAFRLASIHNLRFLVRQIDVMRDSIERGSFALAKREFLSRYSMVDEGAAAEQRRKYRDRTPNSDDT